MELPELICAAQHGDVDAFGSVVERFSRFAYILAYNQLGDAHLAEDATQEAFIDAFLHLPTLREPAAFVPWLRRIIFKHANRMLRRPQRTVALDETTAQLVGTDTLARMVEDRELGQRVHAALATLPAQQRLVMTMFYLAGYDTTEISTLLGISAGAVKKRLHDARKRLKHCMTTLAHDYISSYSEATFSTTVKFLITIRTRNLPKIRELLEREPALVHARELDQPDGLGDSYLPLSGGYSALHRAAADGQVALMKLLLVHGAVVDATTTYGLTPLMSAIAANREEAVTLLLAHGADCNRRLKSGLTPLHWAVMRGQTIIIAHLLGAGANPTSRDTYGRTPRDWARLKGFRWVEDGKG